MQPRSSSAANAYELIIQADDTGKDGGAQRVLNFSSSSTSISLDNIQEADNAEIRVGGSGGSTIESASNTITAIDGVTIVANSADSTDYVSTVSLDTSAMATKVEAMVSAFNGVVSFISTNSSITSSGTNQSSVALGSFVGESTPRMILQMMRSTLSDDYASFIGDRATHRTSLSQMGISTQSSGLLQFSSSEFIETLNDYQSDVENMFSSTSGSFSDAMQDVLDAFIDPVLGIIDSQTDRIAEEIDDYNTAIEFENTRITRYEARLQSQFNNLETLTSSFTTTSSFLTSFFANNS